MGLPRVTSSRIAAIFCCVALSAAGSVGATPNTITVGELTLTLCQPDYTGYCGSIVRPIDPNGVVQLRQRGTFFPYMWEGQPALLHRADDTIPSRDGKLGCMASRQGPLRGIFIPRDSSPDRNPKTVSAWFGRAASAVRKPLVSSHPTESASRSEPAGDSFKPMLLDVSRSTKIGGPSWTVRRKETTG